MDQCTIYILQLEEEKWYIGKTTDLERRIGQHFLGKGSAYTKKYSPIAVHEVIENCTSFDEDKYTKIYMTKYGIDNVRGGAYCKIELTAEEHKHLSKELKSTNEQCYKCGSSDHFSNKCTSTEKAATNKKYDIPTKVVRIPVCYKCGGKGHLINECTWTDEVVEAAVVPTCYKCGRSGHKSPDCYAQKDIFGKLLNSIVKKA